VPLLPPRLTTLRALAGGSREALARACAVAGAGAGVRELDSRRMRRAGAGFVAAATRRSAEDDGA
jgi:hypothetical protein